MIHVAFNIDNNYIDKCKVVMKSILNNTREEVCFHVVGAEIKGKNIKCYEAPDLSEIEQVKSVGHINKSAGYRLLFPEIIEESKVIYLDCDLIVLEDISKLWKYKVNYIGGVLDPLFKTYCKRLGLSHYYINSGVMLMNLDGLREFDFIGKCKKLDRDDLTLPDQDMINIILGDKVQHLPYRWNVYSTIYNNSVSKLLEARLDPAIIHWCGLKKPWNYSNLWKVEEYFKYTK